MSIVPLRKPVISGEEKKSDGLDFRAYLRLKIALHRELLKHVDFEKVAARPDEEARRQVYDAILELASNLKARLPVSTAELTAPERERLALDVLNEVFRLGPLEPLLQDPAISDVLVNGAKEVYVERAGVLEESGVIFKDNAHLMRIIHKIVSAVGRRVDGASPMVDARLADGSRVHVIIPPAAVDGSVTFPSPIAICWPRRR
jgi:pilus assembly protein CpaF